MSTPAVTLAFHFFSCIPEQPIDKRGKEEFPCPYCDPPRIFKQKDRLRQHVQNHHGEEVRRALYLTRVLAFSTCLFDRRMDSARLDNSGLKICSLKNPRADASHIRTRHCIAYPRVQEEARKAEEAAAAAAAPQEVKKVAAIGGPKPALTAEGKTAAITYKSPRVRTICIAPTYRRRTVLRPLCQAGVLRLFSGRL